MNDLVNLNYLVRYIFLNSLLINKALINHIAINYSQLRFHTFLTLVEWSSRLSKSSLCHYFCLVGTRSGKASLDCLIRVVWGMRKTESHSLHRGLFWKVELWTLTFPINSCALERVKSFWGDSSIWLGRGGNEDLCSCWHLCQSDFSCF